MAGKEDLLGSTKGDIMVVWIILVALEMESERNRLEKEGFNRNVPSFEIVRNWGWVRGKWWGY